MTTITQQRATMITTLWVDGPPQIQCALLTHFSSTGVLDRARIRAHLRHIAPHVQGVLSPGSTGEGWEMNTKESDELIRFLLDEAPPLGLKIMVGVLRTGLNESRDALGHVLGWINGGDPEPVSLAKRGVCGFTVTAPKGAHLPQEVIHAQLASIAAVGAPLAIYQLPQITLNEMSPATVQELVEQYPNIYMLKDTSGTDAVVKAGLDLHGLYCVRGAEGGYAGWHKSGGGPYDGFLLSSANCFAAPTAQVIAHLRAGDRAAAQALSDRIGRAFAAVFAEAAALPFGNGFANTNKAIDHHFAHGPRANEVAPPLTHSGNRLPASLIATAGRALATNGFAVGPGYVNE